MKKANEMDAVYLGDIEAASQKFRQVMAKSMSTFGHTYLVFAYHSNPVLLFIVEDITKTGNDFLDGERSALVSTLYTSKGSSSFGGSISP